MDALNMGAFRSILPNTTGIVAGYEQIPAEQRHLLVKSQGFAILLLSLLNDQFFIIMQDFSNTHSSMVEHALLQ